MDLMDNNYLISQYNYDSFIPEKFKPLMRFDQSPELGKIAPDFPLWDLYQRKTSLHEVVSQNHFTIVEFGSFT
jgi:hypothetical protein